MSKVVQSLQRWGRLAVVFALVFATVGELDFRFRERESRLAFDVHDTLYHRLSANQSGYMWMANLSVKSPTISINALGLRGEPVEPARHDHAVLAVGSSSALGAGVKDDETWTARIQQALMASGLDAAVLNGASPGWGPFQHAEYLRLNAERMHASALLVLVSSGDLNFLPMTEEKKRRYLAEARLRKRILGVSPFLAFSLRKGELLLRRNLMHVRAAFTGALAWLRPSHARAAAPASQSTELERFERRIERHARYWREMVAYAESSRLPLVFLVLNPADSPRVARLTALIQDIAAEHPSVRVVEVDARMSGAAGRTDPVAWHRRANTIPNDGHPNARYHQLMADAVWPTIAGVLAEGR